MPELDFHKKVKMETGQNQISEHKYKWNAKDKISRMNSPFPHQEPIQIFIYMYTFFF